MAILEVKELKRYFTLGGGLLSRVLGGARPRVIKAVDGVSFGIGKGEIIGLAGESGCGKSTCCLALAKLTEPTGGSIRYNGKDVTHMSPAETLAYRKEVQIIFQDPYESLNPRFTAFDLVAEPLRALKLGTTREISRAALDALAAVGLEPGRYRHCYPHEMSGGERQRVGIAQALVLEPGVVIADEPLSMLDVSIRAGILDLILDLSARMNFSCLYVSHDLSILAHVSTRLLIMYLGKIVEAGPTRELIKRPAHPYAKALISAVPVPDPTCKRPVPEILGDVSRPIDPPPGCRFQLRCPHATELCRKESPPTLEISPGHFCSCHLC